MERAEDNYTTVKRRKLCYEFFSKKPMGKICTKIEDFYNENDIVVIKMYVYQRFKKPTIYKLVISTGLKMQSANTLSQTLKESISVDYIEVIYI